MEQRIKNLEDKIISFEERILKLENLLTEKKDVLPKKVSLREFLLSKNVKSYPNKTLAIAYYLEKYEGLESINGKDIDEGFRMAKEKAPKDNIPYNLFMCVKSGFIMESKEQKNDMKAYILTNSGEKFVENDFKKNK